MHIDRDRYDRRGGGGGYRDDHRRSRGYDDRPSYRDNDRGGGVDRSRIDRSRSRSPARPRATKVSTVVDHQNRVDHHQRADDDDDVELYD